MVGAGPRSNFFCVVSPDKRDRTQRTPRKEGWPWEVTYTDPGHPVDTHCLLKYLPRELYPLHLSNMSFTPPNLPNPSAAPPGLEHVDTAANLRALAALGLRDDQRDTDVKVTISVIPPSAGFNVTFDNEPDVDERLLHVRGKYALPPYLRHTGGDKKENESMLAVVLLPDHLLEESDPGFFLPSGILDDDKEDEKRLLQKLDSEEREAQRRPCRAEHCLKGRASELAASLSKNNVEHYEPNILFSPVPRPAFLSSRTSSSSSDDGSESTLVAISTSDLDSRGSRSASPDSAYSSESARSSSHSGEKKTGSRRRDDSVYFHASESRGVLLSDIKALKPGLLLAPEEEVLTSWGAPGCPTSIRIVINQHGYHKKSFFVPTRCYCSNITRAKLAYDITGLLELYFSTGTIRPGFAEDPNRRKGILGLYLHSLRRNPLDDTTVWRISVSDLPISWTAKSKTR
ncbi:hypothetical protein LshimejAT787_1800610 [Lyophyllum shimeji]|uniref:Uncharacterized protein n=1 Tax=Lyophyllum shimeji TaxID=47721 RepID=A0A9P3UR61_LYOSH|nr:hypothetical protein LshimejAT787_1800610 [Lyophyllum shimeji]